MRFKVLIIQNIIFALGIISIYKFVSLKNFHEQITSWKKYNQPIIDGDGVGLTFLGFSLDDEGFHWTEIISVANMFLTLGIILVILSTGIIIWNYRKVRVK